MEVIPRLKLDVVPLSLRSGDTFSPLPSPHPTCPVSMVC